jgi:hypothetical protein
LITRGKAALAVLLSVALVYSSAFAEAAPALGQVLQAERARLGPGVVVSGATLFDGDRLETGVGGSLRARLNTSQLYLPAESAAALHRAGQGVAAALEHGSAAFTSISPEGFELRVSDARVRAHAGQPALGRVTLLGANEFVVTCEKGELDVLVGDEVRSVAAPNSYRVMVGDADPGAGPQPSTKRGGTRPTILLWLLVGAAIAGTTYGVWRALHRVSDP